MFQNRVFIRFIHYSLIKSQIGEGKIPLRTADAAMRVMTQSKDALNWGRGPLGRE